METGDRSVLEKLLVKRLSGLNAGELELACCDALGQSVEVVTMFKLVIELEKLIYRAGELVLGLKYRRSGNARKAIRERLCVVVERPRSDRTFLLRVVLGDIDSIPFKDTENFQQNVLERVASILGGSEKDEMGVMDEDHVEGIGKLATRINRIAGEFEEAILLIAGVGVKGEVIRLK